MTITETKKIGLLGGSFNPPHQGHLLLSLKALRILDLDEIWWIPTDINPLKEKSTFMTRAEKDQQIDRMILASKGRIKLCPKSALSSSPYTYDLVSHIRSLYPHDHFIWLMGADNFIQLPKWYRWKDLMKLIPFFVFGRPSYTKRAISCAAAEQFRPYQVEESQFRFLSHLGPKFWGFTDQLFLPDSSTQLRRFS